LRVPVNVSTNRSIKTDILSLIKQFYMPKNIWKSVNLLTDINLSINEGDRVALVGPNGAGKTTLLYLLGGNYFPTTGKAFRRGNIQPIYDLRVGFNEASTGMENIFLRGLLMGMSLDEIIRNKDAIVDFSELGEHIYKPLYTYSSGMKMRLAFAITTCITPDVLLMDEWFSVGDKNFQAKAGQKMLDFVQDARGLVIATHSEWLIKKLCNRVINIRDGQIVGDKTVTEDYTLEI